MASQLKFSVYTCPPIPAATPPPDPSSKDASLWSPLSCTLVYTPKLALLVDCPPSVAATADLAQWIKRTIPKSSTLVYFVASHAHGDHFLGFPELKKEFPEIEAIGTDQVVKGIALQYTDVYPLWQQFFPPAASGTGIPDERVQFRPLLSSNRLDLDGYEVILYDVPHGDTHANSFLHVPDLNLVVAGDIVYNGDCHQHLGEASSQEKRDQWVESVAQIGGLKPKLVIPGHTFTPPSIPDEAASASMLAGTVSYIRGFEEELKSAGGDASKLFTRMRERYAGRWNLHILFMACQAGVAN